MGTASFENKTGTGSDGYRQRWQHDKMVRLNPWGELHRFL